MTRMTTKTYLPALIQRKPIDEPRGSQTTAVLAREVPRASVSAERRGPARRAKPGILRLGHVHIKVRSLDRSVPFYTGMLGLRISERVGRYAFLAIGDEHHSIALEEIGDWAGNPSRRAVGVAHIAFQAPDTEAFAAMRNKLLEAELPVISRNNGISWTFRFKDPDRNEIEIYLDRRHSPGGTRLWGGRWHLPAQSETSIQ